MTPMNFILKPYLDILKILNIKFLSQGFKSCSHFWMRLYNPCYARVKEIMNYKFFSFYSLSSWLIVFFFFLSVFVSVSLSVSGEYSFSTRCKSLAIYILLLCLIWIGNGEVLCCLSGELHFPSPSPPIPPWHHPRNSLSDSQLHIPSR